MTAIEREPFPDHGNAEARETASGNPSPLDTPVLIFSDVLDDLEKCRIATTNRLGALEREGWPSFSDGGRLLALSASVAGLEKTCARDLKWAMRQHPLGPWVARTTGIGEQQAARLLAAIGDPADRPNVAKLWAYCGLHVVDGKRPRRQKGQQANWSTRAKTRAYLCATSCVKHRDSPYRPVYDRERAKWADRDTTDGHKHQHALSVVAKEILKDLWVEARRLRST